MATSDLISQLHARVTHERSAILTSLSLVILAARAYGRAVVDGITSDFKNMHSFEYACRLGRDMGFDGKSLVHPAQLAYSNDAYTPKADEVRNAREIIQALKAANEAGKGTVVVNDKLVEQHHVKAATRLLKLSELIAKLEESHV
jgi:citrate lyase subunit beta/citryl-CoA lyase